MNTAVRPQAITGKGGSLPALPQLDYWLLGAALVLLCFGMVMFASASMWVVERIGGTPFFYVIRHAIAIGLGVSAALLLSQVSIRQWQQAGPLLVFLGMGLLLILLMPGVGKTVNGATRWIPLGPFNLQSSEFMKLFMVIYIARLSGAS